MKSIQNTKNEAVNWSRVLAFHVPVVLIGGLVIMPMITLFLAEQTGLFDHGTARVYSYIFYHQPFRALLLGVVTLLPVMYGFGTDLRLSLRRYLLAMLVMFFLTYALLLNAATHGHSEVVIVTTGGGLIAIIVALAIGMLGVHVYDRISPTASGVDDEQTGSVLSVRAKIMIGVVLLVSFSGASLLHVLYGPVSTYSGLQLGMTMEQVSAVLGEPFAIGNPLLARSPDGSIIALTNSGMPLKPGPPPSPEEVAKEAAKAAEQPEIDPHNDRERIEREMAALAKAFVEEEDRMVRDDAAIAKLTEQPLRANGWQLMPDVIPWSQATTHQKLSYDLRMRFYKSAHGQALLRLTFDLGSRLESIWCITAKPAACEQLDNVLVGMSQSEVEEKLGSPAVRGLVTDRKAEYWQYNNRNIQINFYDKKVMLIGLEEAEKPW